MEKDCRLKCQTCTNQSTDTAGGCLGIELTRQSLVIVEKFCCFDNTIEARGSAADSAKTIIKSGLSKFRDLVPLLTSRGLPLGDKGRYPACVRSVMLYRSETWIIKEEGVIKLERNDARKVQWMCNIRTETRILAKELRTGLKLNSMKQYLQDSRKWFGHVERWEGGTWSSRCRAFKFRG